MEGMIDYFEKLSAAIPETKILAAGGMLYEFESRWKNLTVLRDVKDLIRIAGAKGKESTLT
jgi:hypothetical protein